MNKETELLLEMEIERIQIDNVESFLRSISEWKRLCRKERETRLSRLKKNVGSSEYDEYAHGVLEDDQYIDDVLKRPVYGALAVVLSAAVEHSVLHICRMFSVPIEKKKKQEKKPDNKERKKDRAPDWGQMLGSTEKVLQARHDSLAGWQSVQRNRLLSNCFKHNGGQANGEFVKKFPREYKQYEDISYEREDWERAIEDCRTFIWELFSRLFDQWEKGGSATK